MDTDVRTPAPTGRYDQTLFTAAAAAAERAPQLAEEIRAHVRHLAERGTALGRTDLDVRTLVALIEQAGVPVPPVRV